MRGLASPVAEDSIIERFERDVVDAARHGRPVAPVLRKYGWHRQTWADWRAIATGRMTHYRSGAQVSDYNRDWCRLLHRQVLEAKIAYLQEQLAGLG